MHLLQSLRLADLMSNNTIMHSQLGIEHGAQPHPAEAADVASDSPQTHETVESMPWRPAAFCFRLTAVAFHSPSEVGDSDYHDS
jgi:hypothetical protein